jgi:hypothetical protein
MVSATPLAAHPERFRRRGTFRLFPISCGGHAKRPSKHTTTEPPGVLP